MKDQEIDTTAALSSLTLDDAGRERLNAEIEKILKFFSVMKEFGAAGDLSDGSDEDIVFVAREDNPGLSNAKPSPDALLDNAPARDGRFFVIPNIL